MTNEQIQPVVIAAITPDSAVAARTRRMIDLWSEALCVRVCFLTWNGKGDGFPEPCPAVLFLALRAVEGDLPREPGWLKELPSACALVILSDDPQQAIRAYQWHPAARLSPGYRYEDLCSTMDRCFRFWRQGLEWIDLPCQWDRVRLPLSRIYCAESMGRDTILHCAGGPIRVNQSLSKLEPDLPAPPFLRCQKSFLVHPDAVEKLTGGKLIMKDGQRISIARPRKQEVQKALAQWWSDRGREL